MISKMTRLSYGTLLSLATEKMKGIKQWHLELYKYYLGEEQGEFFVKDFDHWQ